jgi:hypothetical protein
VCDPNLNDENGTNPRDSALIRRLANLTNRRSQMKGSERVFLMLLICTALYIQIDVRIWNGICQLLARFMIGTN